MKVIDTYNAMIGAAVAVLSYIVCPAKLDHTCR